MSDFTSFMAHLLPSINDAIDDLVPAAETPPRRLHEALRYSLFAGGKRIRPALTVLTGDALGVPRDASLVGGGALELLHTYSLIHDDLPALDNDDLRRGRPTLHRQYDEALAILAGDALLTSGLTVLACRPTSVAPELRRRAVEMVGQSIGSRGMIGGQVKDLEAEKKWPEDDPGRVLETIHRQKTGDLLAACVRLAGIYADVSPSEDEGLGELGHEIGRMFQIADDILDVEGTSGALGKTAGKDAAALKLTYPGLYGLDESKRRLLRSRDRALELVERLPLQGDGQFASLIQYLTTRDR